MVEAAESELERWLAAFVRKGGGVAGTVHQLQGEQLALRSAVNIPEPVKAVTARIPRGKGMAGLAWERDEPVHTCNLKTDDTGDVRPGARAVDAQAAVALPVHDATGDVRGVVGIAFMGERDLTEAELAALSAQAESVPL